MKITILSLALAASAFLPMASQEAELSPRVLAQIAALEREKAARTPVQRRVDSQLLLAQQMVAGRAIVSGLRAAVTEAADGRQLLDVRADMRDGLAADIRAIGADVLDEDIAHRSLRVQARLDQVEAIASLPGVQFVAPLRGGSVAGFIARDTTNATIATGSVNSQGDTTHAAATARSTYGVTGAGVKIGVLSNGVNSLAISQASGDLPAVTVLPGQAGSGDEGTAMLEIIHDIAPGAQLYFATATTSNVSFANNIAALRAAGCDILVDNVHYASESPFQDGQAASIVSSTNGGVITQAVKDAAAAGAWFFSATGNYGNLTSGTSGTWEGDYVDGGGSGAPILAGQLHRFGTQNWNVLVSSSGSPISLYWSDPLGAASNDYDLYRLDSTGSTLLSYSLNFQNGSQGQDPYEEVTTGSAGDRLVVVKYNGSARFLHLDTKGGRLSIATAGETYGHSATSAPGTFGVAATPATAPGPFPSRFTASSTIETFSSDGPRRVFFNSDGSAITAGNLSSTGGLLLGKPDFTAADKVSTTVTGFTTFSGTSAAAAHGAAIAALLKSASPSITVHQLRRRLLGTSVDIGAAGSDRDSGSGIIMADTALAAGTSGATFTDNPLVVGTTPVKAVHIAELRQYVGDLRNIYGLPAVAWTDATLTAGATSIKAVHITELRNAIDAVYVRIGLAPPTYTAITAGTSVVMATCINELRAAVSALY